MYKIYLSCFVQYNKLQLRIQDNRFHHVSLVFHLLKQVYSFYQKTNKPGLLTMEKNKRYFWLE